MSTSLTTSDGRTFYAHLGGTVTRDNRAVAYIFELADRPHPIKGEAIWSTEALAWSYRDGLYPSLHDVLYQATRDLHDAMISGSAR